MCSARGTKSLMASIYLGLDGWSVDGIEGVDARGGFAFFASLRALPFFLADGLLGVADADADV